MLRTLNSKILIVEDEMIVAIDLKQRLENMGYNIVGITAKGRDAIKKAGETKPDLILMDITLKGDIDGIKTAQTIRKLYKTPFIYLSGSQDSTILDRAKLSEPSGYITKPFEDTIVQKAIQTAFINNKKSKN